MNGLRILQACVVVLGFLPRVVAADDLPAAKITPGEVQQLLDVHNRARVEVGVGPVHWSPALAAYAQQWADELARTGKFEHRPSDGEFAERYGENLAIGFGPGYDVAAGARSWLDERADYVPHTPIPDITAPPIDPNAPPPEFKVGHYTQMVWRSTTEIGAGKAIIQTGEFKGWLIVVCNYNPPGNMIGDVPY
jgi:hypothetical protein